MPPIGYVKDKEAELILSQKMSACLHMECERMFTLDEYILLLGYYTRLFSADELCHTAMLGTAFKKVRITYKLTALKKDGSIRSVRLSKEDEGSRVLYYITKKGYEKICGYLPQGELFIPYTHVDRPKQYIHDYSSGMNFLGLFHNTYRHRYYHETSFSSGGQILPKAEQGVSADALAVILLPDSDKRIFYIEQDMGTERQWKLTEKINSYLANRLLSDRREILFSFRYRELNPREIVCLNKESVHSLYSAMESTGFTGPLYKFRISDAKGDSYICRECRSSFLRYYPQGGRLTKEEIEEHLLSLMANEKDEEFSSLVSQILKKRHEHFAYQRMFHLWEYYHNALTGKKGLTNVLMYFLSGKSVYGCATPSLRECLPLFMYDRGSSPISLFERNVLLRYFPKETLSYRGAALLQNTQTFAYDWLAAVPLTLPHSYSYNAGGADCMVCVEWLSCDIGSFVRASYMAKHLVRSERVCMILVSADMEPVKKFCELTQYYMFSAMGIPRNNIFICFHILGEDTLFVLHKDGYRMELPTQPKS